MTQPADDKLGHAKREIKALRVQLEQERARMAELKEAATDFLNDCINFDDGNLTNVILKTLSNCLKSKGSSSAWLLRQKADVMEQCMHDINRLRSAFNLSKDETMGIKMAVQHCKGEVRNLRLAADEADKDQES
jgi:hypothetical protein